LRKLIVEHGGVYHAYIDKKTLVCVMQASSCNDAHVTTITHRTHVITCSLTPAKVREFKHMKVVRPEWLVRSVESGILLPWQDFIFVAGGRVEGAQGRRAQISLREFSINKPLSGTTEEAGLFKPNPPSSDEIHSTSLIAQSSIHPIPKYAEHDSNPAAERAMANPAWRAAHTSVAPGFVEGYYAHSRLHHLSMWKAELRTLVAEAQERAERGDVQATPKTSDAPLGVSMRGATLAMKSPLKGKDKADRKKERVIMHVDFDAFFVSAGLVSRPHLRGKPVVVCHSQHTHGTSSTSEIASASYEARRFGIKNGMSLQQARKLCPDILTIPYEFETCVSPKLAAATHSKIVHQIQTTFT
jgi:DNA repair protein REV1